MSDEQRIKDSFVKEIAAPSVVDALARMDEWGHSKYDMYVISVEPYEERDGYIKIYLMGWENSGAREIYEV